VTSWSRHACQLALMPPPGLEAQTLRPATESAMDEHQFRAFYSRTAAPLRAYLASASGNQALADDLLQESYYRLLRADPKTNDENHRKNYLFRIATNLLRDHFRRRREETGPMVDVQSSPSHGARVELHSDLMAVMANLRRRDRELLWLAYVEGMSHREVAGVLGLSTASVRPMLFRARQRMADLLRAGGIGS